MNIPRRWARLQGLAFVFALTAFAAAHGDGFLFNGQSARCLGVMNACAAQADDPSAVLFNPGALALLAKKRSAAAGGTLGGVLNGHVRGPGTSAEQRANTEAVPHLYFTLPVGDRVVAGGGAYSLFRQRIGWRGDLSGYQSKVESYDVSAAAAYAVTPNLGIGAGAVYRTTELSASQPTTGPLSNGRDGSAGWNAGVLYRPFAHWSFALTRRSAIGIFPAQTIAGGAWRPSPSFVFEIDVNRTEWSRVHELAIGGARIPLDLEDTSTLRAGFRHRLSPRTEWHLGYAAERNAQPDETVGPLMHDAPRSTYGAGIAFGAVDVAFSWSTDELREVPSGSFRRNAWLVAVTVTR